MVMQQPVARQGGSDPAGRATRDADALHGTAEEARLRAVHDLRLVGSTAEERFDRVTRIARELFDVPVAEINLVDSVEQFTKSPQPAGVSLLSDRSQSFCDVTIRSPEILVVPDATQDVRFADRTTVTGPRHIRFYAGRPLLSGGQTVGTLCLVDTEPRDLAPAQEKLLDEMGAWVERELCDSRDEELAGDVQRRLLPVDRPLWPDFDLAGISIPARGVGGDFYSWGEDPDGLHVTMADVMGKGAGAAILASAVRSGFQAHRGPDAARTVTAVQAQLQSDLDATETFATFLHCRIDGSTGRLAYADGGHGLTVLIRADGGHEMLPALGLPLGVVPDATWAAGSDELRPGDRLLAFTDGALDLFDGSLDSIAPLIDLVRTAADAAETVGRIADAAAEAAARGTLGDDVSAVCVRYAGGA
ncbi:PP2C family protein-serine/threonine phosphatase [Clavibacter michiganensis]|uniref:Phosphoserine phosphatase RsbU n=1 Tax=Clavibacter michiganensis TaxID=28447 RepID=A0A251YGX0_9MICO|nr:GAF domain-containing SpoIIE family protein phosphatase [Clavibacter michiganensis]OUE23497.1 Phosphoserine phosphatase RsbU [Clavibacter michiganensis]